MMARLAPGAPRIAGNLGRRRCAAPQQERRDGHAAGRLHMAWHSMAQRAPNRAKASSTAAAQQDACTRLTICRHDARLAAHLPQVPLQVCQIAGVRLSLRCQPTLRGVDRSSGSRGTTTRCWQQRIRTSVTASLATWHCARVPEGHARRGRKQEGGGAVTRPPPAAPGATLRCAAHATAMPGCEGPKGLPGGIQYPTG